MIRFPELARVERASFDRVTDHIWIGSRIANMDDYHRLRAQGVAACVDMKREGADPWNFDTFLWLPTVDHTPPDIAHLHMGIGFLRQCEKAGMSVFVHCMAGVGRSATLVLAHLLAADQFTGDTAATDAVVWMRQRRACVNPSRAQMDAAVLAARTFVG